MLESSGEEKRPNPISSAKTKTVDEFNFILLTINYVNKLQGSSVRLILPLRPTLPPLETFTRSRFLLDQHQSSHTRSHETCLVLFIKMSETLSYTILKKVTVKKLLGPPQS